LQQQQTRSATALAATLRDAGNSAAQLPASLSEAACSLVESEVTALWPLMIGLESKHELRMQGGTSRPLAESFAEAGAGAGKALTERAPDPLRLCAQGLQTWVKQQPGMQNAAIQDFKEIGTGSQKSIFMATLTGIDAAATVWVLRQDKNFSSFGLSVVDEYPLLQMLADTRVAAPRPVWFGQGGSLGYPVFAMSRISGSANFTAWSKDKNIARTIGHQVAAMMADLHNAPIQPLQHNAADLPGAVGRTPSDRLAHMREYWRRIGFSQLPLVDACFAWLERYAPSRIEPTVPVHGDFAFHNILVENGRVQGLLDWEFAHFGDAHEDLAYIQPFIESMMDWSDFISAYRSAGGAHYDASLVHWWGVFGMLRLVLGSYNNVHVVRSGRNDLDIRVANSGYVYAGSLLIETAKTIAKNPKNDRTN
jgi:aminoglycoside phosphotransferase (APT) family kinase protein